ncbi:hypothetical protein EJC49_16845 [Aquibium carbonis]|uniref:Uncharacterized protein n=1 Tax=Aquibium carbonis TaxID=2495581 RepID=A0A429YUU3_9HYPH|nr:hypothetical protein EJC49_16845 [Aquibium carbonis]
MALISSSDLSVPSSESLKKALPISSFHPCGIAEDMLALEFAASVVVAVWANAGAHRISAAAVAVNNLVFMAWYPFFSLVVPARKQTTAKPGGGRSVPRPRHIYENECHEA